MKNEELLRKKALEGLEKLGFSDDQEYIDRLEFELKTIKDLGFTPYFLVMWDITKFARKNNILYGPGRGSGCGSLLNYCLKITLIDPIKYGLYFERFLNPSRGSLIDLEKTELDFSNKKNNLTAEQILNIFESDEDLSARQEKKAV